MRHEKPGASRVFHWPSIAHKKNGAPGGAAWFTSCRSARGGARDAVAQAFFAQALHQPLAATLFFGNSWHGPYAAPLAPL